jgi:hypothetical protein
MGPNREPQKKHNICREACAARSLKSAARFFLRATTRFFAGFAGWRECVLRALMTLRRWFHARN